MDGVKVDDQFFEIVPDEARLAAEYIHKRWVKEVRQSIL
jgi:hypothetical protein